MSGGSSPAGSVKQLFRLRRPRGLLEHAAGAPAKVAEVDPALLHGGGEPFREVERLVEDRAGRGGVLAHVVEDRGLGARRDDGLLDPFDPDAGAATAAAVVADDRLERVDPVGARPLAEAEEDHARTAIHHRRDHRTPSAPT